MPYIKSVEFQSALKKKTPVSIFAFAGEDVYTAEKCTEMLVKSLGMDEMNTEIYFAGNTDLNDILLSLQTPPFLSDKKLVILKNAEKLKAAENKKVTEILKAGISCVFVFTWAEKVKADTKALGLFKAVDENGLIVECRPLYDNEIPAWIREKFLQEGRKISSEAVAYLIEKNGTNLMDLSNEIDKLILYAGKNTEIKLDEVEAVSGHTKTLNLNNLQEAIESRRIDKAINIADVLLNEGEIPLMVVGTIYRTFRKMLEAKVVVEELGLSEMDAAKALRMHPYFAKIFFGRLAGFTSAELKGSMKHILDADRKIKSTTIPSNTVVDELLIKILRKTRPAPLRV